jgi:hypothetical protein
MIRSRFLAPLVLLPLCLGCDDKRKPDTVPTQMMDPPKEQPVGAIPKGGKSKKVEPPPKNEAAP